MINANAWRRIGLLILVLGAVGVLVAALWVAPLTVSSQGRATVDRERGNDAGIHIEDEAVLKVVPGEVEVKPGVGAEYMVRVSHTHTSAVTVTLDSLLFNQVDFDWHLVPTMHTGVVSESLVTSTLWVTPSLAPVATAGISTTVWLTASLDYTATQFTDAVTTVVAPLYGLTLSVTPAEQSVYAGALAEYAVVVTNNGNITDSYWLDVVDSLAGFKATLSPTETSSLAPSSTQSLALTVTVPGDDALLLNLTTITATSKLSGSVKASSLVSTTLLPKPRVYVPVVTRAYDPCPTSDQWQAGSGLDGTVYSLAINPGKPDELWAGTDGRGIFKSSDQAATWQTTDGTTQLVFGLVVHPVNAATVYAATWGDGVLRTVNGGQTWLPINNGLGGFVRLYALAITSDGSTLFAATGEGGVYRLTEGQAAWVPVNAGLGSLQTRSLSVDPLNDQVVYAGTGDQGVYKSTNGGDSWQAANAGISSARVWRILVSPEANGPIYAGTEDTGVFRSMDGGTSWQSANSGMGQITVYGLAQQAEMVQLVYAGTNGQGVFSSANGAQSWQGTSNGLGNNVVEALAMDAEYCSTLYAATKDGVWWFRP